MTVWCQRSILPWGHRVIGSTAHVIHVLAVEPFGEVGRDVAGAVIRQEPRPVNDRGLVRAGDDRPDAGHRHQTLTTGVLAREGFNLVL